LDIPEPSTNHFSLDAGGDQDMLELIKMLDSKPRNETHFQFKVGSKEPSTM
jgi:hypothetical protein